MQIKDERLLRDLDELAQIGATSEGGVSRPALSVEDLAGREWFQHKVKEAGLQFRADGAGNLSAIYPAGEPNAKTILAGSHLDSVPNGGRYDGALGVLSALEAILTIKEAGLRLPYHLEVISFTDEEGSLLSLLGSRAFAGLLPAEELEGRPDVPEGLQRAKLTQESVLNAKRDPSGLQAFVELHIEQGTRLEEAGTDIGVVTHIVGIRRYWLSFSGEAAHAGTMPMNKRQDAFWGVAAFALRAREMVMADFSPGVVNVGMVRLAPGAFNIVPAQASISLEFRHGTEEQLDAMQARLFQLADEVAQEFQLEVERTPSASVTPAVLDEGVITAIEAGADAAGAIHTRLMSFAGHDTQSVCRITPGAMFFVPSVGGISHNPLEHTRDEDVIVGANTMLHTLLHLAGAT